jgi:biofilm PGA synthesis lipoprotein PgaB
LSDVKIYLFHSHAGIVDQVEKALAEIDAQGFAVIDPRDLLPCMSGHYPEGRHAVLTFDDGREDRHPDIVPFLRHRAIRVLAFLYVLEPSMATVRIDWDFWRSNEDVFRIGAHSLTHSRVARAPGTGRAERVLTYRNADPGDAFAPALLGPAWDQLHRRHETDAEYRMRIESEVYLSRTILERNFGSPCSFFAYPWGVYTPELVDIVRKAGFEAAFSVKQTDGTRWTIPRVDMDSDQPRTTTRVFPIDRCRVFHDCA